ncbi:Rubredoxin-type Fe(Cys)4 protein [Methanoregula boonei 6A8]|uniref:Rubredoxin n=1 Tax=Methanoregula boonei (strain DSM 21154 / JCM 14090 / 6A8) TaxID=456442 RepID=A7I6M9_METB6|nr:Rubredoxin-type Fe(Cys)4 protein [Methanoregula boonei 6A8]
MMDKYVCTMCGHIYDPAIGETKAFNNTILVNTDRMEEYEGKVMAAEPIKPGTAFADLPADWKCPSCGHPKSYYRKKEVDTLHAMRTISY